MRCPGRRVQIARGFVRKQHGPGASRKARGAIATRCCSPPEQLLGVVRPGAASKPNLWQARADCHLPRIAALPQLQRQHDIFNGR